MYKKITCFFVLVYGLMLIMGGLLGYCRACSMVSLIAGGGMGLLMVLSSLLLFARNKGGVWGSVTVSGVLSILFAVRFFITQKPVPGILALVSAALFTFLLVEMAEAKKKR